jgi:outer membrane protein assembly factor BamB
MRAAKSLACLAWPVLSLWLGAIVHAQSNWPEFRGPSGDGQASLTADLPTAIDQSAVDWQTPIHGKGWSSPVIWGDQIWLTTATEDGRQMSAICVDRHSGKIVHDVLLLENESPAFCHPSNSYATPTPVIEEGRVYVHFGSYLTACMSTADASILWQRRDLPCDHHRGPASSPILFDGKLFIALDGFDVQYVVALDKTSGETVWKRKREIDYGTDNGDAMKAYGTAQVIIVAGQKQLVCPSAMATIAYDPSTGDPQWIVYHDGMNASSRPLYGEGLVFLTNGMGSMVAVHPTGHGDLSGSHVAWEDRKGVAKKSSLLLVDGLLYMNSDDGVVSCREASSGEVLWQKRAGGEYAASPIYASGKIYLFSEQGNILTVQPGREFRLLAETQLGDGFLASPAVVDDELILRSRSMLYRIKK